MACAPQWVVYPVRNIVLKHLFFNLMRLFIYKNKRGVSYKNSLPNFNISVFRRLYSDAKNDVGGVKSFLDLSTSSVGVIARLDFSVSKMTSSFMEVDRSPNSKLNSENWKKWILNGMIPGNSCSWDTKEFLRQFLFEKMADFSKEFQPHLFCFLTSSFF